MKYFFLACFLFVISAIGVGLYFSGSPKLARAERLDEKRVTDLGSVQNEILNFYSNSNNTLPESLQAVPRVENFVDPETNLPYEYQRKGELEFTLCATFSTEEKRVGSMWYDERMGGPMDWNHKVGRNCFDRKVNTSTMSVYPSKPMKY